MCAKVHLLSDKVFKIKAALHSNYTKWHIKNTDILSEKLRYIVTFKKYKSFFSSLAIMHGK